MTRNTKIAFVVLAFCAVALVLWFRQRSAQPAAGLRPQPEPAEVAGTAASKAQAPDNTAELAALKGRLADEMRARRQAEAEAAALRAKVAPLQSNVVVSLGKVEDVGKSAGAFLPAMAELTALSARDPGTLTPEEKRRLLELQRDHAKLLGALPEITKFQDNPDDYARFFRSMLQQAAGLTDPEAVQVEAFMRQRGVEMNQLGLNAGKEPGDPKLEEEWEERRDQFNERTAEGLKKVLPPGAAEKAGLTKELMEFLEMDFDKIFPQSAAATAQ
jgi:hypothetical protein